MRGKKIKIRLIVVLILALAVAGILFGLFGNRKEYDFKHLIEKAPYEEGQAFVGLDVESPLKDFVVAAENDLLTLMINPLSTEVAVLDKRSEDIWYSNPKDGDKDPVANGSAKDRMASQLTITYYNEVREEMQMNSFEDSVEKLQFELDAIENGVRVDYTIGNMSLGFLAIPDYIKPDRLQTLVLDHLDSKTAKKISRYFVESREKEGFMQLNARARESNIMMNELLDAFYTQGTYTEEELALDIADAGVELDLAKKYFTLPMEYRLDGDSLSVTIAADRIEEVGGIQLGSVDVLPFFGAGSVEDTGYLFVPSGSGGIIQFNNGKQKEKDYLQPVYGTDYLELKKTRNIIAEDVRLPVYGIKNNDSAFLACIDQGDAIASIEACVSQKTSTYNNVFSSFVLRSKDELVMSGVTSNESNMVILPENHYTGDIVIDYTFLNGDQANYSGMALAYRDKLIADGDLFPSEAAHQSNFYLDLVGAVEKSKFIVGFRYKGLQVMTDYQQAGAIVSDFTQEGVNNIQLRYIGWFNRGINHDTIKDVDPIWQLGNDKDMAQLEDKLVANGGNVYMDISTQLVGYYSDHYSRFKEASRYLDGFDGFYADYNRATLRMSSRSANGLFSIVSPNALPYQVADFVNSYQKKMDVMNLSLRDMGSILNSDKKESYPIDRTEAQAIVGEQMGVMDQAFNQMMVAGGNAYSVAYADHLIDVPTGDSGFFIIDYEIPFYEMVFNGVIPLAGKALNVSGNYNYETALLKHIEYGLNPHFLLTAEETFKLQDTPFEDYYSTGVDTWLEDATQLYGAIKSVDDTIGSGQMLEHIIHSEGVNQMIYDNGVSVYVNYTDQAVTVEGVTVEAKSYVVEGDN